MKLILENIKCHTKRTFEFEEGVSNLIDAPSGMGKTSLFDAFIFVITGEGTKIRNVVLN